MPTTLYNLEGRDTFSQLQKIRGAAPYLLPKVLESAPNLGFDSHEALGAVADHEEIAAQFPKTYGRARISLKETTEPATNGPIRLGVVLSGGQAPGGHNVIAGIYDYIKKANKDSVMLGFLDGPQGIYNGQYTVVNDHFMDCYRNSGGFDMIASGRHKIEKPEEFANAMANCIELNLDGLVVIGGDDSNTNAAVLAEYFEANGCKTKVCGAPKTIDGDLKVDPYIPISFGFDTACRTFSEEIGNLGQDTLSSQKYWHFVRLMGRAASNIALECALQTRPNVCLISEEVEEKKMTLLQITQEVVDVIVSRSQAGKQYGLVLLPEGLIEFIPEFNLLISEINDVLAHGAATTEEAVTPNLSPANQAVFSILPPTIKQQLLLDRDPHGNVQVAKIETERLLAEMVKTELAKLAATGGYAGSFVPQYHSYGYEGRCGLPSAFDATYCYALGYNVAALISLGHNGLISSVTNLNAPVSEWRCGGVPITMMCHMEKRSGHMKAVIKKALVELDGEPFKAFSAQRADWAKYDLYRSPGPIQYFTGSSSVDLCVTLTLELTKTDARLNPADVEVVKRSQDGARLFGRHYHAPLTATTATILSDVQKLRATFKPTLSAALARGATAVEKAATQSRKPSDRAAVAALFPNTYGRKFVSIDGPSAALDKPMKVGVAFFGRQAPGGHDVISGVLDSLPAASSVIGFVGGVSGLVGNHTVQVTPELLAPYRGGGGSELLGRSTDNLAKEDFPAVLSTVQALGLDGLILLGGSRTNTAAAYLTEYLFTNGSGVKVVTTPVDLSNSIKNEFVETAVGFDTATKVAGQIAGNNATDGASAKKYWYFQRLIGGQHSHSTLEVALQTKPNYVILSEEVRAKNLTLADIAGSIADVVAARAAAGKNYGTLLVPEGIVEEIPELRLLISEIDAASQGGPVNSAEIKPKLSVWSRALLESMPDYMQAALLFSRGSDKSFQVSQAETEKLLAHFVEIELKSRKNKGTYKAAFSVVPSFIGYQARGAAPSNFDVNYAYNLGFAATRLVASGYTGYIATVNNLRSPVSEWLPAGVPITAMISSNGSEGKYTVTKSPVDLNGAAFAALAAIRELNKVSDRYENPGPLQFLGPQEIVDGVSYSLSSESTGYLEDLAKVNAALRNLEEAVRPGCSPAVLRVALSSLTALNDVLTLADQKPAHA